MNDGFVYLALGIPLGVVPSGVVVQGEPTAFFGTVKPVFVVLIEDLATAGFQDVQDFI